MDLKTQQQQKAAYANTRIEAMCNLDIRSDPSNNRLSGVICTIGPSSSSPDILFKMMQTGMNIGRLNLIHGTKESNSETIKTIRKLSTDYGRLVAIGVDTNGPIVRTGFLKPHLNGHLKLEKGKRIKLTTDSYYKDSCDENYLWVDYVKLPQFVKPYSRLFLDDGAICLSCDDIEGNSIHCTIRNEGILGNRKTCHFPGVDLELPFVSAQDKEELAFALSEKVDIIFVSNVKNSENITEIRNILDYEGRNIKIIAKIESYEAIKNFQSILKESDGIMVSRGVLGTEIPIEKIFLAQKKIIGWCNRVGKPVICAAQMLDSMISKPRPTRAESTDVANAILDGADCVMLSEETAIGNYPLESVKVMVQIAKEAESAVYHRRLFEELRFLTQVNLSNTQTTAIAAVQASINCQAAGIVVVTATGNSAKTIAHYRPRCPIIAVMKDAQLSRQLHLHRAVFPIVYNETPLEEWSDDMDKQIGYGLCTSIQFGLISPGVNVVVVTGWRRGAGNTNTVRIVSVPEIIDVKDMHVLRTKCNDS